jgi:hypothetical protein
MVKLGDILKTTNKVAMKKSPKRKNILRKAPTWAALICVLVAVLVMKGFWHPHPGYHKLEKELDSFKLPSTWQEIGPRTGEKDYWFGVCRNIDVGCPSLEAKFLLQKQSPNIIEEFSELLESNTYEIREKVLYCQQDITRECRVKGQKDNTTISISVRNINVEQNEKVAVDILSAKN